MAFLQILNIQALPRHKYGASLANGTFNEQLNTDTPPAEFVSSGPWMLKQFISGDRLVFVPNPNYYRYDAWGTRLPYLDEFVMLSVPDFDAMALRFQAGDLDLIDDPIQAQTLSVLQDGQVAGDYTLYNPGISLRNTHYWFNLNPGGTYADGGGRRVAWQPEKPGEEPPPEIRAKEFRYHVDPVKRRWFEQVEFRRACSMATNRDAIVKTVFYGQAEPLYGFETPGNKFWYNPDIPRYPYDPAAAAALLDSIGITDRNGDGFREDAEGNTIRFTLITNKENKIRERIGVLLKEDLGKLGFDVQAQVIDFNNIITRIQDSYEYEACLLGLSSGVPPSPADSSNVLLSNSRMHQWNPLQKTPATPWEARIDELFAQLRTTFDEAEQQRLYDELQAVWAENQPMIHLIVDQLWIGASNRIGNVKPSLMRPYLAHNTEELYLKPKGSAL
jgi:peptide/nickel transport system substrate-binding protein